MAIELKLKFRSYQLVFKVIPLLIATALVITMLFLARWQLGRAQQKQHMLALIATSQAAPAVKYNGKEIGSYKLLKLTGRFDNAHNLLLTQRFYHHMLGVEVFTPFILQGSKKTYWVDRGWMPAQSLKLLGIFPVHGMRTIKALVVPAPKKGFSLGAQSHENSWPRLQSRLNFAKLGAVVVASDMQHYLVLEKLQIGSLIYTWVPATMPPSRHRAYAIQWLLFAVVLLFCAIYASADRVNLHS